MCVNCNDSLQVNLPVAPSGLNGTDGQSAYVYVATANDASGNGFTYPMNPAQPYIAIINTTSPLINPVAGNFTGKWHNWVGPAGPTGSTGATGPTGPQGMYGGITFEYTFLGFGFAGGDPTSGKLGITGSNALTASSITISHTPLTGGALQSYYSFIASITSTNKAAIKIYKKADSTAFYIFQIVSAVVSGSYTTFTLATPPYLGFGAAAPLAGDNIIVSFGPVGDKGNAGNYVTTAAEAPGANCALGGLRVDLKNGVTNAIITTSYICKQDNIAAGIVNWFAGTSAPTGYLVCDGSAVSALLFPALYAAIGNTYDTFNGQSAPGGVNFRVPDLRGLFVRGSGTSSFDPSSPRSVGDLQQDNLQNHRHSYTTYVAYTDDNEAGATTDVLSFDNPGHGTGTLITSSPNSVGAPPDNARYGDETRPKNVALLPCIKY